MFFYVCICILFFDVWLLQVYQTASSLFSQKWKSLSKYVEQNKSEANFPFTSNVYKICVKYGNNIETNSIAL